MTFDPHVATADFAGDGTLQEGRGVREEEKKGKVKKEEKTPTAVPCVCNVWPERRTDLRWWRMPSCIAAACPVCFKKETTL